MDVILNAARPDPLFSAMTGVADAVFMLLSANAPGTDVRFESRQ